MDRYEKVNYINTLLQRNKEIDLILEEYPLDYELIEEKETNNQKVLLARQSNLRVLLGTIPSTINGKYLHLYYLVDLDQTLVIGTNSEVATADIDLTDFINSLNFPKENYDFLDSRLLYFRLARAFIREIIISMFKKKEYNNWEEVKNDLLAIEKEYQNKDYQRKIKK